MVLCGHSSDNGGGPESDEKILTQVGDSGNTVYGCLTDYQDLSGPTYDGQTVDDGDGWLRLYDFYPSLDEIRAVTYSPYLHQYDYGINGSFYISTVASVSPSSGPTAGSTKVTISGANFVSGATVSIGGKAATGVTVVSSTSITATTRLAQGQDVVVTNPGSIPTYTGVFTYVPAPTVTTVSPSSGPTDRGHPCDHLGSKFC